MCSAYFVSGAVGSVTVYFGGGTERCRLSLCGMSAVTPWVVELDVVLG